MDTNQVRPTIRKLAITHDDNPNTIQEQIETAEVYHTNFKNLELTLEFFWRMAGFMSAWFVELQPQPLALLLVETGLATSLRDARTHIKSGAVTVNKVKVVDERHVVGVEALFKDRWLLLRRGKSGHAILHFTPHGWED